LTSDENSFITAAITNEDSFATTLLFAMKQLLGDYCIIWEPESLWLELEDHGIDMPRINRDKFLAASSLVQSPAFYWDGNVFEKTTMAFNNILSDPEILQEASPAELSWAVFEAKKLRELDMDFDYEPMGYAAVCMHRAGLQVAPEELAFAQAELERMNLTGKEMIEEIRSKWGALDKADLAVVDLSEDPIDVQVAQLVVVELYMQDRRKRYKKELEAFPTTLQPLPPLRLS